MQSDKERLLEDIRQGHEELERVRHAIQSAQDVHSEQEASFQIKAAEVEGLSRQVKPRYIASSGQRTACNVYTLHLSTDVMIS